MSRSIIRRSIPVGLLVFSGLGSAAVADPVTTFGGITTWVGSGSNSAALVIDWNDPGNPGGDTSLVWGYHWTGAENGAQMLEAVIAADPHLYALFDSYNGYVFGLGYNQSPSNALVLSPLPSAQTYPWSFGSDRMANTSDNPFYGAGVDDSRSATGPGQLWEEGLDVNYWSYWLSSENSGTLSGWGYSNFGMTDTADSPLQDGQWQGFSFDPNEDWTQFPDTGGAAAPTDPVAAAVPEPADFLLLLMGLQCLLHRKRRPTAAR